VSSLIAHLVGGKNHHRLRLRATKPDLRATNLTWRAADVRGPVHGPSDSSPPSPRRSSGRDGSPGNGFRKALRSPCAAHLLLVPRAAFELCCARDPDSHPASDHLLKLNQFFSAAAAGPVRPGWKLRAVDWLLREIGWSLLALAGPSRSLSRGGWCRGCGWLCTSVATRLATQCARARARCAPCS